MATPVTYDKMLALLKAEGLKVIEVAGARDRCRCHASSRYPHGHHSAGGPVVRAWGTVNGTVTHITGGDLGGRSVLKYIADIINNDPNLFDKCQFVVAPDGVVYLNSVGRCNHAGGVGSGVQSHLIAADFSTSSPYDSRFRGSSADGNAFTMGIENIAAVQMNAAQRDSSVRINAALARHYGWTGQESVGHGEISAARTKADPNLDMGKFRRDVMARVKKGAGAPAVEPPPVVQPPVNSSAKWGKPDTWTIGATGPDVTRLGQRIALWSKALGLPNPYLVGPGPNFGPSDVAGLSALQVKWGFGSKPTDLAKGGNSDGYPGAVTFSQLEADPPGVPTPEPQGTVDIKVMFIPMAGYNSDSARGVTHWEYNTNGLAKLVNDHNPDVFGTTELSDRHQDKMRPLFDSEIKGYARGKGSDAGGSDGRYVYRNKATTNYIASGYVQAARDTLFNGDDKQAAWAVVQIEGGPKIGVISAHTENQDGKDSKTGKDADVLRVEQMLSMVDQCVAKIKAHDVDDKHIIAMADTNSVSAVKDAMVRLGWEPVGPGYFHGWDHHTNKPFDWAFIKSGTVKATAIDHKYCDHTALDITWTVSK